MFKLSPFFCATLASASLILTGCQHMEAKPSSPNQTTIPTVEDQFQLQGKIGVRTPKQSGSAFFTWQQQQDNFDIELTGILGVGKTQISGQPGQVTLNSAKTGLVQASSAEELLERATGWQAPITHLKDWVQARSVSSSAIVQKDDLGRLIQLQEDNWIVDYSYEGAQPLPNRLILKQRFENAGENRITMLIQNRSFH